MGSRSSRQPTRDIGCGVNPTGICYPAHSWQTTSAVGADHHDAQPDNETRLLKRDIDRYDQLQDSAWELASCSAEQDGSGDWCGRRSHGEMNRRRAQALQQQKHCCSRTLRRDLRGRPSWNERITCNLARSTVVCTTNGYDSFAPSPSRLFGVYMELSS